MCDSERTFLAEMDGSCKMPFQDMLQSQIKTKSNLQV